MKVKMNGTFNKQMCKSDGTVVIRFKFPYSEIAQYANMLTMLNSTLDTAVETEDGTLMKVGPLNYKSMKVDKDGECTLDLQNSADAITCLDVPKIINKNIIVKLIQG